jgi:hypothetical protein
MLKSHRAALLWALLIVVSMAVSMPAPARAYSLLPLMTEEAQTLPEDVIEATLGISYFRNMRYPPFTPPSIIKSQTLMGLPQLAFRVGVGGWAEFQASYEMLYLDETAYDGKTNNQYGGGDARIFTKLWFARERAVLPAIGMRFGTKLPNATRSTRLGTDDTDFAATVLLSKTLGPVTTHVNLGISLLGNSGPSIGNSFSAGGQDDLFVYAVGLVSKPLGALAAGAITLRLLGEVNGQTGSHFNNDLSDIRIGLQMQRGGGTLYVGVSTGLVSGSEEIGASTGFTYAFDTDKLFASD